MNTIYLPVIIYIALISISLAVSCVLIYMAWKILLKHEVKVTPEDMEKIKNMERKKMP